MTPGLARAVARLAGLVSLWAAVELLERVAYAAGVADTGAELAATLDELAALVDEDLAAADCSDVVAAHAGCCGTPA